jgi:hypothetical protein
MPPPRRLRLRAQLAVLLAVLVRGGHAFPLFFTANGSAMLTSAHGADILLQPDGAGSVITRALLQADGGVQLNATTLNEAVLSGLLSLAQAQSATLAQLVAIAGAGAGASGVPALQTTYKLTTCGMAGPFGPNLAMCRDAYAPAAWAADAAVYGFGAPAGGTVPNWQRLTLPQGGRYSLSVAGASGSPWQVTYACLCRGAIVQTVVDLPAGTTLYALVGSQPFIQTGYTNTGGGGGTFLLFANGTALAVAGGGGGGTAYYGTICGVQGALCDASFATSGQPASTGGTQSSNGLGGGGSCGGGGLNGPGAGTRAGTAALAGGYGSNAYSWAGFGGGGTSEIASAGGGGGYSGGDSDTTAGMGGGGGSFCGTSACDFGYSTPSSDGYVTLTLLAAAA